MASDSSRPYHHGRLRSALLDAAERTLRKHGADRVTLRELAREVGVSHAAPHRHFADRQALLDALAVLGFERLHAELQAADDRAGDTFAERLHAAVAAYIHFATRDAALLELMFTTKHRAGADAVTTAAAPAFRLLNELIISGQETGALAAGRPEKIGIVLFATMQGIATLINGDLVDRRLLDGLVEEAVRQFLRGARSAT